MNTYKSLNCTTFKGEFCGTYISITKTTPNSAESSHLTSAVTFFPSHHRHLLMMLCLLPWLPAKENTINSKLFDQFRLRVSRDFGFHFCYWLHHLIPVQVKIRAVHNRKSGPAPVHNNTSVNYYKNNRFLNHCCDD